MNVKEQGEREKRGRRRQERSGGRRLGLLCSLTVVLILTGLLLVDQAKDEIGQLTDALSIVAGMDDIQSLMQEGTREGQGFRFESIELSQAVYRDLTNALESFPAGAINLFAVCEANNQLLRSNGTSTDPSYRVLQDAWW